MPDFDEADEAPAEVGVAVVEPLPEVDPVELPLGLLCELPVLEPEFRDVGATVVDADELNVLFSTVGGESCLG